MSDIVKDSETLKQAIIARIEELGLTGGQIAEDSLKRGVKGITERAISVWRNHSYSKGALNQFQIIWLAYRLGIRVRLTIGEPVMDGKKLKYLIPQPYNEELALKRLMDIFPYTETKPKKKKKK